jgi:phage baseplate assembly protein W
MSDRAKELFGSELAFPFQVENGTLKTVSGIEVLEQRIKAVVETEQGELVMHPEYGWPKRELIAKGDSDEISKAIKQAIIDGVKQIDHSDLDVKATPPSNGMVEVTVTYSIKIYDDNRRTVKVVIHPPDA